MDGSPRMPAFEHARAVVLARPRHLPHHLPAPDHRLHMPELSSSTPSTPTGTRRRRLRLSQSTARPTPPDARRISSNHFHDARFLAPASMSPMEAPDVPLLPPLVATTDSPPPPSDRSMFTDIWHSTSAAPSPTDAPDAPSPEITGGQSPSDFPWPTADMAEFEFGRVSARPPNPEHCIVLVGVPRVRLDRLHSLKERLSRLLRGAGVVLAVSIPTSRVTGMSKGVAFVEFESTRAVQAACRQVFDDGQLRARPFRAYQGSGAPSPRAETPTETKALRKRVQQLEADVKGLQARLARVRPLEESGVLQFLSGGSSPPSSPAHPGKQCTTQELDEVWAVLMMGLSRVRREQVRAMQRAEPSTPSETCCVCLDHPRSTVVLPCGHVAMCGDCARTEDMVTCPLCRAPIQTVVDVYL